MLRASNSSDKIIVERVIDKLEGLLTNIRNMRPDPGRDDRDRRPKAHPPVYVANHLGCSVGDVRRWIAAHRQHDDEELSARFLEVYGCIATELAEVVSGAMFKVATNPAHAQAFAAQKWLLPRMDPDAYGDRDYSSVNPQADVVPTAVLEACTNEERAELERLDQAIEERNRRTDEILATAKRRAEQD